MKKRGLWIGMVFSLVMCLCLALFCACGGTVDTGDAADGKSAYDIWLENGHSGTESDFLEWLKGEKGEDGKDGKDGSDGQDGTDGKDGTVGKSAYDIWKENGHSGTESDFLEWLKGEKGDTGEQGAQGQKGDDGQDGKDGKDGKDGQNGTNGQDGKSAYDIWKENGHSGTEAEFLEWLKGEKGENGQNGADGQDGKDGKDGLNGQDGKDGADGQNGKDGLSAYELFLQRCPSYEGSEGQWLADLVNGNLTVYTVTFQSEVADDIVYLVCAGKELTVIPKVPEKEGQASAKWDRDDFTNITSDIEVHAVYTMKQLTVTFHNEYTEEEDVVKTVEYGQAVEDVPVVTPKEHQKAYWDVTDFSCITDNMTVNAVYETEYLKYTLIGDQYSVSTIMMSWGEKSALKELFIPAKHGNFPVTMIEVSAFEGRSNIGWFGIEIVHLPETIVEIGAYAFSDCYSLRSINMPISIEEIGTGAFECCDNLTEIIIPPKVKNIYSYTFLHSGLQNIDLSNVKKVYDGAFSLCSSLQCIDAPNLEEIEDGTYHRYTVFHTNINESFYDGAFALCTALKEVNLPKLQRLGAYAFLGDESIGNELTCVKLPNVVYIGDCAFKRCYSLANVDMQNVSVIGSEAFRSDSLTKIIAPNATTVGAGAFRGLTCEYVEIPNVSEIQPETFYDCRIKSLVVSNKLKAVQGAFDMWSKLETIYFEGKQEEYSAIEGVEYLLGKVYYYEITMPETDEGNYWHWHYSEDGKTPVVWKKDN